MSINSITLRNFKGFKGATLPIKPLTVLIGPNSAGKSCFGQALVALSKSNANNETLSLALDEKSSVNFGNYSDLIHHDCGGQLISIEIGLSTVTVKLGFGPGNDKAGIKELELTQTETIGQSQLSPVIMDHSRKTVSQTIKIEELIRDTNREWTVTTDEIINGKINNKNISQKFNVKYHGIAIDTISKITGTAVNINDVAPNTKLRLDLLASILRGVSYLRPDRDPPQRKRAIPTSGAPKIDDFGVGTDWFVHKNRENYFDSFFFPDPSPDQEESKNILKKYQEQQPEEMPLLNALSLWLDKLGLASFFDVRLLDGESVTQSIATPKGQNHPRPLTDLGYGVSQVLPILVKGLTIKKGDLLVVEQPEAQLHPKPQAVLADFFCAMVKCGRNVIVETHSVELFHRLRLRASMDDDLAEKIGVFFLHEPENGVCCNPFPISLKEENEFSWPKGFLPEGIEKELEILAVRLAREESN